MLTASVEKPAAVTDYQYRRIHFELSAAAVQSDEMLPVEDDMDFLGGIGRSYKIARQYDVGSDPFAPSAPLIINTGCLTGTGFMTGLRTYFSGYSPLKRTLTGVPMPSWSAMSGSFGRKLVSTGIGDLILTGAAAAPSILVIEQSDDGPQISVQAAPPQLIGTRTPERINHLNEIYNDRAARSYPAHFAVIGPAGENWRTVWYACIVSSTQEGLMSGEDKFRFAGRLGMGSVLGSKNIHGIVVIAAQDTSANADDRLKEINKEIGRGPQSRGFRHPMNRDGLGGTGKNARLLDGFGILPVNNFEPRGENLATPVHLETMRESEEFVLIDKGCFGCQIACHQDFYAAPEGGKDPDPRKARRNPGPYLGRYEYEPAELSGPNLGVLDPHDNLALARLDDDLGFDTISINVVLSYLMDFNTRGGKQLAGGVTFGDAEGARRVKEDIAYGRETLLGKGVKAASEEVGGGEFAMHCKGVEHSAYLGQTNPGYPFAVAGGHMSMRTFLLYVTDPKAKPESADYWIEQITNEGWKCISKDLHGACLFALNPPAQIAEGIESIYGVPFSAERLMDATYRAHILGYALERKQGTTLADYDMPEELFTGQRKGDLPGANFLSRELFDDIRGSVFEHFNKDIGRLGYADVFATA